MILTLYTGIRLRALGSSVQGLQCRAVRRTFRGFFPGGKRSGCHSTPLHSTPFHRLSIRACRSASISNGLKFLLILLLICIP